jgi:hypothetical protein
MFKRFSEKPVYTEDPGLFLNQFFNLCPCDFFFFLPEILPPFETVTAKVNSAARLTGGEGGPAKGGVSSGKSLQSRRGMARRR